MPISYTLSNFSQDQHGNGLNPAEEAYKIWRKNFQALPSNHILSVGSFCLAAPCTCKKFLLAQSEVWAFTGGTWQG